MSFPKRTNPGRRARCDAAATLASALTSALTCALTLGAGVARAEPAAYVFVPYDDDRRELQWLAGVEQGRDGRSEAAQELAFGFSPTPRWFTQWYAGAARSDGHGWRGEAVSWLNHVQLLRPDGARPWGLGWLVEAEWPRERSEGREWTIGPTLQWDADHAQVEANLQWHRAVGAAEAEPWQLGYQWQWSRLWRPGLELGLQGFGDVGAWNHWAAWAAQSHTVGPALFWKWRADGDDAQWVADAAALVGVGAGSPRATVRARLRYEF